ncbi:hypothetical protein [Aquabacterium sp. OR-4]|uniref:hypothetical protein n=1 Tax=Aquabacterium sp. OR-4 TaxID=2978127 RepID=UPI0028C92BE9|nr:hypothetical protein [Aquabacterium sp. OR-4]MDT7837985.1 hypothetical protein [Aquabacterium sp. OR-4]
MTPALDTARTRSSEPAPTTPATDSTVFAQRGDHWADLAERHAVDEQALRAANPTLSDALSLAPGQAVRLPDRAEAVASVGTAGISASSVGTAGISASSVGTAGISAAGGREGLVQALQDKAYQAGRAAPQAAFDGTVLRAVPTSYEAGALDHRYGGPGRSNARGQGMLYTAPDPTALLRENAAYARAGEHPLALKSVVEVHYTATPDAQGRGGVADMAEGARRQGLPVQALTEPKGGSQPGWLHQLTGEHPYTLAQQAGKGASDSGASALRAPAAVGGEQIDIVSRNTRPDQLQPAAVTRHDADGRAAPRVPATGVVHDMPADARRYRDGPLDKPAGARPPTEAAPGQPGQRQFAATDVAGQALAAANEGLEGRAGSRIDRVRQHLSGARDGYPRAASTRYGAAGGAAATLVDAGLRAARGESVNGAQLAQDTAVQTTVGAAAAKGVDALTPRLGLVKAGGAVGALVQAGASGYTNVQAYRAGTLSGSRAVANTVVDTGTAAAAGAAGAWAGAAVGSVVPVAGTAIGAVVGFGVGLGAHYAIGALDRATGVTQAAKSALANGLQSAGDGLSRAWNAITPW